MSAHSVCNLCGKLSQLKCAGCFEVYYCSKNHQKLDWEIHKRKCLSYKIEYDKVLGRHLIASRFIHEGEIIIKEKPLIDGPAQATPPVCLVCYELLSESNKYDCSRCGWPTCSKSCEKLHCNQPECRITSCRKNGKVKITSFVQKLSHPSYQCLTVLRCLSLRKDNPVIWEKLMELESHCKERKFTSKYNSDEIFIAKFISEFLNFTEFSNEEILKVAGIVEINAHEVPLKKPGYIAIYEKASLLEHNCRANCRKSFTNCGQLVIRAAETIHPGDHLSICYTDPLWGKEDRIKHLLTTKFFSCQCCRCVDPLELNTHFNSLKCSNVSCDGFTVLVKNESILEDVSEHNTALLKIIRQPDIFTWQCQNCQNKSTNESQILEEINETLFNLDKKCATSCMSFLNKYKKFLHENHHIMINVKLALADALAWPTKLPSLDDKTLDWTIEMCDEVYNVLKVLVPAENRILGVLLYQLHFALIEKSRRKIESTNTPQILLKCQAVLERAYKYLLGEPDALPEGMIAQEAKKALENFNWSLSTLKN